MANVKSYEVKQSLDNLKKYRLFTEGNLKPFIHKEFDQFGSLLQKIMLEGEVYRLLTQLPLTVEERNSLVMYSRSFCQCGTELEWFASNACCFLVPIRLISFLDLTYIFHGLNTLRKLQKQAVPFESSVYFRIVTRRTI